MDEAERAGLVTQHLDLPRRVARVLHARVRDHLDYDELLALGNLGLAEAANRYDPAARVPFRSFAWYRVHGAILDGVRRNTSLPRRVWAQLNALAATADYLEGAGQRAAVARDHAASTTTADRLREIQAAIGAIRTMHQVALDGVPEEALTDDRPRPDQALGRSRQAAALQAAIGRLPERERQLLRAHYVDGQTLLEAGAAMGLSKSWASRLHARAIDQLRTLLTPTAPPDP
ncbi:MAG: sigma-70 family RNA polymerase sigma factor [Kofleriaceae bacterium]